MTDPSSPALAAMWNSGASIALRTTLAPVFSSPSRSFTSSATFFAAWIYAEPPPEMIPSSTAALVALSASSIRSLASFISVSVAAPTLITATPPASFASLSWSFSLSNSDVVSSSWALMTFTRPAMSSLAPIPSTITVFSFVILALFARPRSSRVASLSSYPSSSEITLPPVRIAISWSISFLLSP